MTIPKKTNFKNKLTKRYVVKNASKYMGDPTIIFCRSGWEAWVCRWCDTSPQVVGWGSETVVIPYLDASTNKMRHYFIDFLIKLKNGKTILVELKPLNQTKPPTGNRKSGIMLEQTMTYVKNLSKWSAAIQFAEKNGFEFQIWVKDTLIKLGII